MVRRRGVRFAFDLGPVWLPAASKVPQTPPPLPPPKSLLSVDPARLIALPETVLIVPNHGFHLSH